MKQKPEENVVLYTVQDPGHDITQWHAPPEEYWNPNGSFVGLAKHLKWDYWAWALPDLKDFDNDWFVMEKMLDASMWVLSVPASEVRWYALDQYCKGQLDGNRFHPDQESIRRVGDIPQGLVKRPIRPEWVVKVVPVRELLFAGSAST